MAHRILILGNAGSGKTTLARAIAADLDLPILCLDEICWDSGPQRRGAEESLAEMRSFMQSHPSWIVEGCYGELLAAALPETTEVRYLNPGVEACVEAARRRAWEPEKFSSAHAQEAMQEALVEWIGQYEVREDEFGAATHRRIFESFAGAKHEYRSIEDSSHLHARNLPGDLDRKRARRRREIQSRAAEHVARGDASGWFDQLYREAEGRADEIPWADLEPNRALSAWLTESGPKPGRALVVACGLGDDAELLAARGWEVTAFDISPEAIAWCRRRFPQSQVRYVAADLFALADEWVQTFDLVVEIYTVQALPTSLRREAIGAIARLVSPGGHLFFYARACEQDEDREAGPPWPLSPDDIDVFLQEGLTAQRRLLTRDDCTPPVWRVEAVFLRPA